MSGSGSGAAKHASVYENYFELNYPPLPLPMIWRVVYHEAVRGNHILWSKEELAEVEERYKSDEFKLEDVDKKAVTKFMAKFMATSDFQALRGMIQSLTLNQKALAFILYNRSITLWKRWLKTNLH